MQKFNNDDEFVYDNEKHQDWINNDNFGVSHMGCLLADYNVENIGFDVFHGTSNVTK